MRKVNLLVSLVTLVSISICPMVQAKDIAQNNNETNHSNKTN